MSKIELTEEMLERQKHLVWMLNAAINEERDYLRKRLFHRAWDQVTRFLHLRKRDESLGSPNTWARHDMLVGIRDSVAKVQSAMSGQVDLEPLPENAGAWFPSDDFNIHGPRLHNQGDQNYNPFQYRR